MAAEQAKNANTETSLGFDKYKPAEFQLRKEREKLFTHIN